MKRHWTKRELKLGLADYPALLTIGYVLTEYLFHVRATTIADFLRYVVLIFLISVFLCGATMLGVKLLFGNFQLIEKKEGAAENNNKPPSRRLVLPFYFALIALFLICVIGGMLDSRKDKRYLSHSGETMQISRAEFHDQFSAIKVGMPFSIDLINSYTNVRRADGCYYFELVFRDGKSDRTLYGQVCTDEDNRVRSVRTWDG